MVDKIESEALKWLKMNQNRGCSANKFYSSPRISSEYPDCSTPFSFDLYNFCSFGCILEGTKILMEDGTKKNIEELKISDRLWSYNIDENTGKLLDKKPRTSTVTVVTKHIPKKLVELWVSNKKLVVTPNHKILTETGWKEANDLIITEKILRVWNGNVISEEQKHQFSAEDFIKSVTTRDKNWYLNHNNEKYMKESVSKRMKINNPMRNEKYRNKMINTRIEKLKSGEIKIHSRYGMGNYSNGQQLLYEHMDKMGIKYIKEYSFIADETCPNKSRIFVDAFIPEYGVVVEYDGYPYHSFKSTIENDKKRDNWLMKKGLTILRICGDDVQNFGYVKNELERTNHKAFKEITKIKKIDNIEHKVVYDIQCDSFHNFVANHTVVHNCLYCFAYFQKMNNPSVNNDEGELKAVNVDRIIEIFEGKYPDDPYYKHFIKERKVMHIGGMADNFCNFERKNKRGIKILEYLLSTGYPIIISTKGDFLSIPEYAEMFEKYKGIANCAIQSSIITDDDVIGARIEVGVPSPTKRYENLKRASEMGYYTILRLRPFIIGISDRQLDSLLKKMVDYKIHAISTEFYAMDMRVNEDVKERYKWMGEICGFDIVEYYKELSPSERGTYRRLNRDVKEQHIKKIYKFCVDNGKTFACSDPDFKELNMTGSCCGLPNGNEFGKISNWLPGQLTNHLQELRKRYWASKGVDKYLYLKDIEKDAEWLKDREFSNDDVCKIGKCNAEFQQMTLWGNMTNKWNNTRSPACPYNYFHGKIKPSGKYDEKGNIIYEYVPSDYEVRWHLEGVL